MIPSSFQATVLLLKCGIEAKYVYATSLAQKDITDWIKEQPWLSCKQQQKNLPSQCLE